MKKLIVSLLIAVIANSAWANENNKFVANNSNSQAIYLGNDTVFINSQAENGPAYIQNIKTMEILKKISSEDLGYQKLLLPDGNLVLSGNRKLNTKTLEIEAYPMSVYNDVFFSLGGDKYLAFEPRSYCIFDLKLGCTDGEKDLPSELPFGQYYKLNEDATSALLITSMFGQEYKIIKFNKRDLSWKELVSLPAVPSHHMWLSTMKDADTVVLLLVDDEMIRGVSEKSILNVIDLKTKNVKTAEIEKAFVSVEMIKSHGDKLLVFGKTSTGCWGTCPTYIVEDAVVDLKSFNMIQAIGNQFKYREVVHSYDYKNTALYNLMVETPKGEIIRIGSPFYQNKNFNEWFSIQKLEFIPYDSTSVFKNICKKQEAFLSALDADFKYRWCSDISESELSEITFLIGLNGKNITNLSAEDLSGFSNLKSLNLSNNKLTYLDDETLKMLQGLETLVLKNNPISEAEKTRIVQALPGVKVLF